METYLLLTLITLIIILILVQVFKINIPIRRSKRISKDDNGLGLDEIVQSIRHDIVQSQKRIRESGEKGIFYVEKAQVTISFLVKKSVSGTVKLVAADADSEYATERLHQVTLDLSTAPPLMQTIVENAISRHKNTNDAIKEINELFENLDAVELFVTQNRQMGGE